MTPELQSKIIILRQKANEGTLTLDEMKEAIVLLRGSRRSASIASETSRRTKARKEVKSADELLGELEGLL